MIAIIALMAFFNIIGSKYSSYYNSFATIVTLLGLGLVIGVCVPEFGSVELFKGSEKGFNGILAGAGLIFFSYVGFEDLVKMAEEAKSPRKDMPRAILISGLLVLVLYILITISSLSVLSAEKLATSPGPLAAVIKTKLGQTGATILAIVALFATSKTILSNILGTSRLLYDVARDTDIKWLKKFTTISGIGNAPNYAIIAISVLSIGFALIGNLKIVASISNIFIFIVFGMVNIAMISFRMKQKLEKKEEKHVFRIPFNINNIPIPTILAFVTLIVLFGFNLYNIVSGMM